MVCGCVSECLCGCVGRSVGDEPIDPDEPVDRGEDDDAHQDDHVPDELDVHEGPPPPLSLLLQLRVDAERVEGNDLTIGREG